MSDCPLVFVREESGHKPFIHRCPVCQREVRSKYRDPAMRKQVCGSDAPPSLEQRLKPQERAALEAAAQKSGMLLGDALAAMTTAIGIPPCGGCEKRKAWLNAAHQWFKDLLPGAPAEARETQ